MRKKIIFSVVILGAVILALNILNQINTTLRSSDRLSAQAEIVYQLEAKNRELKKKFSKIQTEEFIEQQARDKLGLGKDGETVVIIPEDKLKMVMGASQSAQIERLPNWLGWFRVFFR
jgi:cell division protein FtsB